MDNLIKVKNHDNLRRDQSSNAVINVNNSAYVAARKRLRQAKRIDELENTVNNLSLILKEKGII